MTKVRIALVVSLALTVATVYLVTQPRPKSNATPRDTPFSPDVDGKPASKPPAAAGTEPTPDGTTPGEAAVVSALQPIGIEWNSPEAPSRFSAFAEWTDRYRAASPAARPALEEEGVRLATERRAAMLSMIQQDPERALELAVPLAVRKSLPAGINGLLETRVSGRGEYTVMAAYPSPTSGKGFVPVRRSLTVNGRSYRAYVYGTRTGQPSKSNLPFHGIAIDDSLAPSENPMRILEPSEIDELQLTPASEVICGVSEKPVTVANEKTPVDVGGEVIWLCRGAHAEILNSQLQLAASQPGTGFLSDGGVAESPYTEGRKRVIMMRVAFSNLPTPDISSNQLVSVHAGVNNFWRVSSYGKTQLAPLGAGSDIVLVTLSTPSTDYDGDAGAFRTAVRDQATASGVDFSKYDFDVIYSGGGRPSFDFGGLGYVGGPGSWVVGASTSITAHEMGHNLGAPHANYWDTGGQTAIGTGDNQEYGDPYDVMGGGSASGTAAGHYVSKFKWRMGWLLDADFPRISASGTYRIYTHDDPISSGVRGVRFGKTASLEYFLEFRQLYGANRWMTDGVELRWGSPSSWSSQLIDTTPGSANGKNDAAILIGRTFSDPAANVHITPIGKGHTYPESIDVVVRLGSQAGNQPPVAVVTASKLNAGIGEPITFTATASDPNGDALAYYWEFSDSNVSSDNSSVQTAAFGSAGEYTARCVVSDMRGGTSQQTVVVRVGSPSTFRISGHIVDNRNQPVSGILVTASGPVTRRTYSDSDGSYVMVGLPSGSYAVSGIEPVSGSMTLLRPYFTSPLTVGPNFVTADFVGIPGSLNIYTPLVTKNATGWRYNDTGTDLGVAWRASAFVDSAWATGTAPLGYPSGTPITTVVGYGPNSANKYPTTYFRRQFNVGDPTVYTNLQVELLRDDSAAVYLNGVELVRDNLAAGATYTTFASANSGADAYLPFTVPRAALVAGANVLAVEVHQANATSSDIVMDVALSGLAVSNVTGLNLVYLAEPANGAQFIDPASVALRANVLTGGTPATRVDYYANGSKVAESASEPYLAQWSTPPDGTHVLSAVALVGSTQFTSPPVRIIVGPVVPPLPTEDWISMGASWRYLSQASAAPANWMSPGFNDAAWPLGAAELGFGDGDETTVVPGGPSNPRFTTLYFRRTFVADDPAAIDSITSLIKRDDGAVVYINGAEVYRDNIAAGSVTYATLAATADDDGETVFSHSVSPAFIVHGTNTIAVEVHQSSTTSSDLSFDLSLSAALRTNRTRGCWITSPGAGSSFDPPGSMNIGAEVVAGNGLGISMVEFYVDGIKIGEDATSPFTFSWGNPASGTHTLSAIATDSAGQLVTSAGVGITVTPPPLGDAYVSFGDVWKYRDDGANLGTPWTGRLYNDSTWKSGAAKLGYGVSGLTTTVSYGTNGNSKHITTYFRKGFFLPTLAGINRLALRLIRDDGAVVYLNGLEVFRDNLQSGPVSWNSTASTAIGSPADSTPLEVVLPTLGLVTGTNVISVEIHQANPTSSDIAFDLALSGLTQTNAGAGLYLASPADNTHYNMPATVALAAFTAATPDGPVDYYANGNKIGESSVAPYQFNWANPSSGTYSIEARAQFAGGPATSPSVTVTVGNPPPPILPVFQTLVSPGSAWRYLDSSSAPGNDWNKTTFNDSSWPLGAGRFGHGLDGEVTTLIGGRTTHYFRRWFTAQNAALYSQLFFYLVRDDGAVVYLNGQEVFRSNMPSGPITAGTLAAATVNTPEETAYFESALASIGSGLLTGSNLVAVELHQSAATSSDAGFDLALYGSGTTEPRIYIGSPVQNANVAYGRTLPIEVFASAGSLESVSLVEIFANGVRISEGSSPPYRVEQTFTGFGLQTISARMTTSGGAVIHAAPVSFTVVRESVATQMIAAGTTWKYLDDGSNQGTGWVQPGFNDAAWPTGTARFGYGGDGEITPLRETRVSDGSRIIAFYFRKAFIVLPGAVYTNLTFNLLRDDGAIVWVNGREAYRVNLPLSGVTFQTVATEAVGGADEQTYFPTFIAITNLPVGNNIVAVEIHQQSTSSSDVGFDLQLTATGYVEDTVPPELRVEFKDGMVELSWPTTYVGWRIYTTASLGQPWELMDVTPFVVNGRNVVAGLPSAEKSFYRLSKQPSP